MAHNTGIWLVWFTMNSLQQIILFIFSFVFSWSQMMKKITSWNRGQEAGPKRRRRKKGLELFDLNNIYRSEYF